MSDTTKLLEGVRVLSFGTFVAGSTASRMLADLGAEVAKIEARSRPEVLRSAAHVIGDLATEPSGVTNTVMYASMTRGLRNLSIDLALPEGQALFHRLVGVADIVVENFGGPLLERWGCGYHDLLADNPRLVMLSMTGYGRTGPRANYLGYALSISSYIGLTAVWGYAHLSLTDHLTGATGALAAVAALWDAQRNGTPTYLDVAQIDAWAPLMARLYAMPLNEGRDDPHASHPSPCSWLAGVFPSRGYDQWVAVDIENGEDWTVLCDVLERRDLIAGTREEATARETELREALVSWLGDCSAYVAMHHLQRAGLAAAVVQDLEDVCRDAQVRARGFTEQVYQPDLGLVTYQGSVQRWTRTPGRYPIPPARLGEDTSGILSSWLDIGDDELRALEASGAIFCA